MAVNVAGQTQCATPDFLSLLKELWSYNHQNLSLNMARGKPCPEQLDLSNPLLDTVSSAQGATIDGIDCRNYGHLSGFPAVHELMGDYLRVPHDAVIVTGQSSLNSMYDLIIHGMVYGIDGNEPMAKLPEIKWVCPVPGYDRHFSMLEKLGITMLTVDLIEQDGKIGPDMDQVCALVEHDPLVKGMWAIPMYSNPTGITYSDEVMRELAALKPAAPDFRIYMDNAYAVHHLYAASEQQDVLLNPYEVFEQAGSLDMLYLFGSLSKVTFAGGGIAALSSSPKNLAEILDRLGQQTVGYDKLNDLRHVRFFGSIDRLHQHMQAHADILRPKFELVETMLGQAFGESDLASWTTPRGGYFVTFFAHRASAARIVELCKRLGVVLTGAGAPYPYRHDPHDAVIRLAPSYPSMEELTAALKVFIAVVLFVSYESEIAALAPTFESEIKAIYDSGLFA